MVVIELHTVPLGVEKVRLSDYAGHIFKTIPSKKGIKKAIKRGELFVNGRVADTGYWIKANDKIELLESKVNPPKAYKLKLEVVYEDDYIAIINKPAGISVSGNQYRTIQNALIDNVKTSTQKDALKWVKPAHRLDNPTSGLLLVAKTSMALMSLGQQFENKEIQKTYAAIVMGKAPVKGKINLPIDGLASQTDFELVKTIPSLKSEYLSLLKLFPKTGRTHQIRKHLSQSDFPILGDKLYGKEGEVLKGKGLFLVAIGLTFKHPATNKQLTVEIEPPQKFYSLLEREHRRWEKFRK